MADLFTTDTLCAYLGVSQSTLYRRIEQGHLPKPFKLNGNRWRKVDIDTALAKLAETAQFAS